ncbi:PIF1 helicase, partial [Medicago truncatula]
SLKQVSIYLLLLMFLHGQFYVSMARVTSRNGLKILLTDEGVCIDNTLNVMFKEIFRNV